MQTGLRAEQDLQGRRSRPQATQLVIAGLGSKTTQGCTPVDDGAGKRSVPASSGQPVRRFQAGPQPFWCPTLCRTHRCHQSQCWLSWPLRFLPLGLSTYAEAGIGRWAGFTSGWLYWFMIMAWPEMTWRSASYSLFPVLTSVVVTWPSLLSRINLLASAPGRVERICRIESRCNYLSWSLDRAF